jgi:transposase
MYIDIVPNRNSPPAILLREARRQGKKIVKVTLANLSHLPPQRIDILRRALKGELDELAFCTTPAAFVQGPSFGALFVVKTLCDRLGITTSLGKSRFTPFVLLMIAARLLEPGSKLAAMRWAKTHAINEIFGLAPESFDENNFYQALSWLAANQADVEQNLFRHRYSNQSAPELFLYDVTSSYLEGTENELADYGYNRDKKQGKKQIVIGLLTDIFGSPVAVRVFEGNTSDTTTVPEQISILANQFGVQRITLVGDKGMLRGPQIQELTAIQFNYITAISKSDIRAMLATGLIQLSLFDENITSVTDINSGIRYVLRRNPERMHQVRANRNDRIQKIIEHPAKQTDYLNASHKRRVDVALRHITAKIERYNLTKIVTVKSDDRTIEISINHDALSQTEMLDGCYVIKSNLPENVITAAQIHDRYKDLSKVEQAFRTMKTGLLEIRPLFVRRADHTRGHVFMVMLSYLLSKEIESSTIDLKITTSELMHDLDRICIHYQWLPGEVRIARLPKPTAAQAEILQSLEIKLPEALCVPSKNGSLTS